MASIINLAPLPPGIPGAAAAGPVQKKRFGTVTTPDATVATVLSFATAASSIARFDCTVVSRRTSSGDTAVYTVRGAAKQQGAHRTAVRQDHVTSQRVGDFVEERDTIDGLLQHFRIEEDVRHLGLAARWLRRSVTVTFAHKNRSFFG